MIKIAFCDDDIKFVSQIEDLIFDICKRNRIQIETDAFYSGKTLEQEIMRGTRYDLIYLDIEMQNGDGITAATNIRKIDKNVLIIFISSYDSYLMQLFRLNVFAFIKKPVIEEEFAKLFLDAYEEICNKDFYFIYSYKSKEFRVPCNDIVYFESRGRQIKVSMRDGNDGVFNDKLNDVEKRLENGKVPFLRIHQSFLVNYKLIKVRTRGFITMVGGNILPVSEDRQKIFSWEYMKLLREEINNGISY